MPMIDAAFIEAVIANPDDDSPRLIYADYLEEQGEYERAEFIRVQVELANTPEWIEHPVIKECPDRSGNVRKVEWKNPRCEALRRRERELFRRDFAKPLADILQLKTYGTHGNGGGHDSDPFGANWTWSRGFQETLSLPFAGWLTHSTSILRATPIRVVKLTTRPVTGQDSTHVWLEGMPRISKDRLRLGEDIAEKLPPIYWPRIRFELPQTMQDPTPGIPRDSELSEAWRNAFGAR